MQQPVISLCLPTNGIIEWVFPVLDSIYNQDVELDLFEVIVTNNGNNEQFDVMMQSYAMQHKNLIYKKTDAYLFHNQLEALKLASGSFLKLVNHRGVFAEDALKRMIDIIQDNIEKKPVIYFGNGALEKDRYVLKSFDEFVCALRRYASWTTGVGIWKDDYDNMPGNIKIDKISPHSCILFSERKKSDYLIENYIFAKEIDSDHSKKGKYDLFKAFAVEEIVITLNLFIDGDISSKTFKSVKRDYRKCVAELYWVYMIKKNSCSYDLSGFEDAVGIFFSKSEIVAEMVCMLMRSFWKKICKIVRKR